MIFFSIIPIYLVLILHEPGFLFLYAPIIAIYIAGIMELKDRSQQNSDETGGTHGG
jgi:hypothetical protein